MRKEIFCTLFVILCSTVALAQNRDQLDCEILKQVFTSESLKYFKIKTSKDTTLTLYSNVKEFKCESIQLDIKSVKFKVSLDTPKYLDSGGEFVILGWEKKVNSYDIIILQMTPLSLDVRCLFIRKKNRWILSRTYYGIAEIAPHKW